MLHPPAQLIEDRLGARHVGVPATPRRDAAVPAIG
jgi:hypothetical protein